MKLYPLNNWVTAWLLLPISRKNGNIYLLDRFFFFRADIDDLQYVVVGMERRWTDINLYIILEERYSQSLHFLRPSGTPHQCLSIRLFATNKQQKDAYQKIMSKKLGCFYNCPTLFYLHCTALVSGYKHFKLAWFTKFPHRAAKHICTSTG